MAGFFGNPVARHVSTAAVFCPTGSWVALRADSANKPNRQWIKIQPKGRDTIGLAIRYVNKNSDGTFTTPTSNAHPDFIYPSTVIIEEPISEDVTVFGRAAQRGGSSGGLKVIVAEFA